MAILATTLSVWQARRADQAVKARAQTEEKRATRERVNWALETALPEIALIAPDE
jgi:hypothetical protein